MDAINIIEKARIKKTKLVSYRITEENLSFLERLKEKKGTSKSAVVNLLIENLRKEYEEEN